MKKIFIIVTFAVGLLACEKQPEYGDVPILEALSMEGGVDWVLNQQFSVDMEAFRQDMTSVGFEMNPYVSFGRDGMGVWHQGITQIGGQFFPHLVFLDQETLRICYEDSTGQYAGAALYKNCRYELNSVDQTLSYYTDPERYYSENRVYLKLLYYRDGILIVENARQEFRKLVVFEATDAEKLLQKYSTEAIAENDIHHNPPTD